MQTERTRASTHRGPNIVVPGSISNLGPGFDALSVAVQVYLRPCSLAQPSVRIWS
jgi:homoserine kinase